MKRIISILAAALLLIGAMALAETEDMSVIDRFSDVWVDDNISVEIWFGEEDKAFHCTAVHGGGGEENEVWEYAACRYDAETDTLICEDGVRALEHYDEAAQALQSDVQAEGLTAEFSFREGEDVLLWKDSEGLAKDYALKRLDAREEEAYEEAQGYVGRWGSDRATIDITDNGDDSYNVDITWANSAAETTEWHYKCVFDDVAHHLYNYEPGTKAVVTYGEDGEPVKTEVAYEDGAATFAIDEDGLLSWADAKENAAEGMRFEPGIVLPEGYEGKVIYPMSDTVDMNEGTYPVEFEPGNVADGQIANAHIYTEDCYDIVDMAQMKAGDALFIEGRVVIIDTLEEDEYGKQINGGFEVGGYTMQSEEEDNCFKSVGYDDYHTYTQREVATLKLSENVTFTDGWDIEKEPETFTGIEAVTKAITQSEFEFFDFDNTELRLEGGEVVEIIRRYVP